MNWYMAKIVFRIICGEGDHKAQFDEQLRLIHAESASEAFDKAAAIAMDEEEVFVNNNRKLVQWKFINVSELHKINALIDGAELYSRIQESDNANLYMENIHKRAAYLKANTEHSILQTY